VAISLTFSEREEKVTLFSGLTDASGTGEAMAIGEVTFT
jgi:hypothetical protein